MSLGYESLLAPLTVKRIDRTGESCLTQLSAES